MSQRYSILAAALLVFSSLIAVICLAEPADFAVTAEQVYKLMEQAKAAEAAVLVDEVILSNQQDTRLTDELFYMIAEKSRPTDKYKTEKELYWQMMHDFPDRPYVTKAQLGYARADIQTLILNKKFNDAETALNQMITDFPGHLDLPDALYWIAERYRWAKKFDNAKGIYQQIIDNYPDNPFADRARFGAARAEVLSLIVAERYSEAKEALDKMIQDFPGHPEMADSLYRIAREFGYKSRHEIERDIYESVISNYPQSPYAEKARLGAARALAQSLIVCDRFEEAQIQIEKIKEDFSEHPDLQDAIYWIGERYEWSHKLESAKVVYQDSAEYEPNSLVADKARFSLAKTNIKSLLLAGDKDRAAEALDSMLADYGQRQIPYDELEWIARNYEATGDVNTAYILFEQIARDCPSGDDSYILAKVQLDKYELFAVIEAGDRIKTDKMVKETGLQLINDRPAVYAADGMDLYINTMGQACYFRGWDLKTKGDNEKAVDYFSAAIYLWERVFTEHPNSPLAPIACFAAATQLAQEFGDYSRAAEYSHKVADNWPDCDEAALSQYKTAQYLQEMANQGLLPSEQAEAVIKECYQDIIEKYPSSKYAKRAVRNLEKKVN